MFKKSQISLLSFYVITIGFLLVDLWFVVSKHTLMLSAAPVLLLIILLAVFSFDKLLYLVVFFTPLSIPLKEIMPGFGFDMYLPTEPIIVGLLLIFILKLAQERGFDKKIVYHPVSIAIYIQLIWFFITALTSTMPLVSFKFLLSRIWFVAVLYFLMAKLFEKEKNIEKFIGFYVAALIIVIGYTTYRHLGYGLWNKQAAHFVVSPFYNDHTAYGAVLAMFLPMFVIFTFRASQSLKQRMLWGGSTFILFVALILSYSRAAWLSVIAALGVWLIMKLRIKFRTILIVATSVLAFVFVFQDQILMTLESNSEESSTNLMEHVSSMSNISSDASNLERINRWGSAIRMFKDRPFWGHGPGTYMFVYASYQLNKDRTIISTNAGDAGNAHSEYLGPLSEAGVLGLVTFLLLIGWVIYTAVKTYFKLKSEQHKAMLMGAFLGLITYYVHGFLNNFLDTDKLSVPFWGFTAIIVAIDIFSKQQELTVSSAEG